MDVIYQVHYLPLSEDTELEKWMTDGGTSRMATQLPSTQQGYQDAGELMVVKIHLLLRLFLRLGTKNQQLLSG